MRDTSGNSFDSPFGDPTRDEAWPPRHVSPPPEHRIVRFLKRVVARPSKAAAFVLALGFCVGGVGRLVLDLKTDASTDADGDQRTATVFTSAPTDPSRPTPQSSMADARD